MKFKVGQKIAAGYALALLIFISVEVITYQNITEFIDTNKWVEHTHKVLEHLDNILSSLQDAETGQRGFIITGEEHYLDPYNTKITHIYNYIQSTRELTADNPGQQLRLDNIESLVEDKLAELQETIDLRRNEGFEAALELVLTDSGKKIMDDIRELVNEMDREERDLLTLRNETAAKSARNTQNLIILAAVISTVLLSLVSFIITRNLSRPLQEISMVADRIAEGDLSLEIKTDRRADEIGILSKSFVKMSRTLKTMADGANQIADGVLSVDIKPQSEKDVMGNALATMVGNLQEQTRNIQEASNNLASSSGEISTTVIQLASSVAETASSVNETSTTVQELKQTAQLSYEKSEQVSRNAQDASQVSREGLSLTEETGEGMNRIRAQMDMIAESITNLSEQSQAIGAIITTVNDLSEQSNLLAVNAAIEAAKAGEQGKGFVVVAEEIRRLAEQSKEATSQVQGILQDIQKGVSTAVMTVEQGTKAADIGVQQSKETGEAIRRLADSIGEAAEAVIQIAASSRQQLVGVDQVSEAISNIREASIQNSQGAGQLKQAAGNLRTLGFNLEELVSSYKV
jgi:methyl-accepting chemotaxis protein